MTELRKQINNIVEDYNACKVLAESVGNPSVYEGTTATAGDIIKGKTAYSNGEKLEGTLEAGNAIINTTWTAEAITSPIIKNLKRIEDTITVSGTSMQSFFRNLNGLVTAPNVDTSNITNMNYVCMYCSNLTKVPLWNTSKVTDWQYSFLGCKALKTVPEFDTSASTNFEGTFGGCTSLISAPAFNTVNVRLFGSMFSDCTNLQDVPVYNFSGITWRQTNALQEMFKNCTSLSDDALNNIMASLMTANGVESNYNRSMQYIGLTQAQAERCKSLPNWAAYEAKGLITGY